ncbi:MAG TPA: HD domain-containing protein [Methanoregula sp.]|nr:HD domain-containing protein [Methanoregula sp.]
MAECPGFLKTDPAPRLFAIKIAADHAARAHRGQFRKDRRTPYVSHPAKVAALTGMFGGSHVAVISAWLHDVYEDCTPEWLTRTDALIASLRLPPDERLEISAIVEALTKKNTIKGKAARLSDSLDRILDAPPEATLVKLCDRIDNFLDSAGRNGRYTKRYLASTDELIGKLSTRASLHGYDVALGVLVEIRNSRLDTE